MQPIESVVSGLGTNHEAGTGSTGAGTPKGVRALVAGDAPVRGDTATISQAAKLKAGAWGAALDSVQSLLGRIRVGSGAAGATRAEVKGIHSSVQRASTGGPISNIPLAFTVSDVAEGVERFRLVGANLQPGESAAVEVEVTQSARRGELTLDFGGPQLDLVGENAVDPTERFVLEISGADGVRQLTFSSGTTIDQLADSLNFFKDATGVEAEAVNGALRLRSARFGDDAFVSVRILEDGGAVGSIQAEGDEPVAFSDASQGVVDNGQSLRATINGVDYTGDGLRLRSAQSSIDAIILLEQWRAQTLGSFAAAIVSAPSAGVDVLG